MGKVSKWFRGLLPLKSPDSSSSSSSSKSLKHKRRWSFVKSYRESHNLTTSTTVATGVRSNENHTAAGGHCHGGVCVRATAEAAVDRREQAAVKIQAAFRGCLARRALRALKGLVKLQALVRGQVERKRTAERLQKMQLVLRAQTQVRAGGRYRSSNVHLHGPATPDKVENPIRSKSMKYDHSSMFKRDNSKSYGQVCGHKEKCWKTTDSWVDEKSWNRLRSSGRSCVDDGKNVRILEMDSEKGIFAPKRRARNLFHTTNLALVSDTYSQTLTPTKNSAMHHSGPIQRKAHQSYSPPEGHVVDETPFCTANNSPLNFSGSSRESSSKKSPFTPSKSDGSRSYVSAYSDCPNYMAYTESSKAKVRSLSAPKQRTRYERSGSAKLAAQRASGLHASFTNKANPGYDRLASLPMGYRY